VILAVCKRSLAVALFALASIGLLFNFSLSVFAANIENGSNSTVGTVPVCTWKLDGVPDAISLKNTAYEANKIQANKYKGVSYPLVATTTGTRMFVSAVSSNAPATDASNCSWYGNKFGAKVVVSTPGGQKFTGGFAGDTSMDFDLTYPANPLWGLITPTCTPDGQPALLNGKWLPSVPFDAPLSVQVPGGEVTSIRAADVRTISQCSYDINFRTTVPAGLKPTRAGQDYVLTGPTIVTTLVISGS